MFKKEKDVFNISFGDVSVGIVILDAQQHIIETNESIVRMFGYKTKELHQLHLQVLFSDDYKIQLENQLKGFLNQRLQKQKERKSKRGRVPKN